LFHPSPQVYCLATGRCVLREKFATHIGAVALDPATPCRHVAVGCFGGTVEWLRVRAPNDATGAAAASAAAAAAAAGLPPTEGREGRTIRAWKHGTDVNCLAIDSPGATLLAVGSADSHVTLYPLSTDSDHDNGPDGRSSAPLYRLHCGGAVWGVALADSIKSGIECAPRTHRLVSSRLVSPRSRRRAFLSRAPRRRVSRLVPVVALPLGAEGR